MAGDAEPRFVVWDEAAPLYGEGWSPFGSFSEQLVELAAIRPGERVVDLGTGNGIGLIPAATAAAPSVVLGVDFSTEMLAGAQRRASAARASNIELARMDVATLSLPDGRFDVAVASSVLQFVGFSADVVREWCRVLRVGGRLLCSIPSYGSDVTQTVLLEVMRDHASALPVQLAERVRNRGSFQPPDLAALCLASGFKSADASRMRLSTTVPDTDAWWQVQWSHGIRGFLRAFDPTTLAAVKSAASERVGDLAEPDGSIPINAVMDYCHATK